LRVLSSQMGVLGDVKGDKAVVALLWEAAGELVKAVAADGEEVDGVSDRPGRWGQAMMELGSTVCTPKPNCAACPITETCRAYAEGLELAQNPRSIGAVEDIEDLCTLCAPFEEAAEDGGGELDDTETEPSKGDGRLSRFFAATQPAKPTTKEGPDARTLATIVNHARKFPLKKPKKKVREEETLVCAIRRSGGQYLIHRRPDKGLLGGLWELPSHTLPASNDSTAKARKSKAMAYVAGLMAAPKAKRSLEASLRHAGELGSVPWLFSHLKLTMHVHLFEVDDAGGLPELDKRERWASVEDIGTESMGTGMKKCWSIVKKSVA
jgi:A/G-specific adenine glycosylase